MSKVSEMAKVVREEMRLAINNGCPACYSGDQPIPDEDGRWWHEGYDETEDGADAEDRECDSWSIHDALARIDVRLSLRAIQ